MSKEDKDLLAAGVILADEFEEEDAKVLEIDEQVDV